MAVKQDWFVMTGPPLICRDLFNTWKGAVKYRNFKPTVDRYKGEYAWILYTCINSDFKEPISKLGYRSNVNT